MVYNINRSSVDGTMIKISELFSTGMFIILCALCISMFSCESDYEGLEMAFSAFVGDNETENAVTMQPESENEDRVDVEVHIGILPGVQLHTITFGFSFNPGFIELSGYDESEYFGETGSAVTAVDLQDEDIGIIRFTVTKTDAGIPPVDGLGKLLELHFRAVNFDKETAQNGRCKDYTRESNFTYIHFVEYNLLDMSNGVLTGISWYGGVFCIFDNRD